MGIGIYTSYQYKINERRHRQINYAIKAGEVDLNKFKDVL
jgi:hypothetical protein